MCELERHLRSQMGDSSFEAAYRSAFGHLRADRPMGDYPLHEVTLRMVQSVAQMQEAYQSGEEPNCHFMPYGAPGVPTPQPDSLRILEGSKPRRSSGTQNTSNTSSGGCYIATAVYGSYDCPQVWTLRRYRDYTLKKTWCGRLFIRVYYKVSPTLVKYFGTAKWFKCLLARSLNKKVNHLQQRGIANTPYED
jgi:hypothetical protein